MTNPVHESAKKFRSFFEEAGVAVGELTLSTNRHGEHSAYFAALGTEIRVSDHSKNENFSFAVTVPYEFATREKAMKMIEAARSRREEAEQARLAKREAEAAAVAAEEARKEAAQAEAAMWAERKALFLKEAGLTDATQTAQKKAWDAYKKATYR